ncbi:MAG TPA: hypothetical protein VFQ43_17110 [Nitrososphaera sp.]|nr:hypothetical protein [Nitrososphaera sp.]
MSFSTATPDFDSYAKTLWHCGDHRHRVEQEYSFTMLRDRILPTVFVFNATDCVSDETERPLKDRKGL